VIGHVDPSQEGHVTETFDKASLEDFREKFPVALETDDFELKY